MTLTTPPAGIVPEDYERIEAAVMETERGRWFLLEFARRQRAAETRELLEAIARLERSVAGASAAPAQKPAIAQAMSRPPAETRAPKESGLLLAPPTQPAQPHAETFKVDPRLVALSRLDRLPLQDKLALFA